jgi:hypothetical protein
MFECAAAIQVAARIDGQGRRLLGCLGNLMVLMEILNSPAVGHHVAVESPFSPEYAL